MGSWHSWRSAICRSRERIHQQQGRLGTGAEKGRTLVVRARQALKRHHEAGHRAEDTAGLAAKELERVRVLIGRRGGSGQRQALNSRGRINLRTFFWGIMDEPVL